MVARILLATSCRPSALATALSRRTLTTILVFQHELCAGTFLANSRFAFLSKFMSLRLAFNLGACLRSDDELNAEEA
jgi:hypothetical protein